MACDLNQDEPAAEQVEETPLCLRCLQPVDPLTHYCPHCGEAVGRLTTYIPFVNIRWQANVWGRMWRQLGQRDTTAWGRLIRFLMILVFAPILLVVGLPFVLARRLGRKEG